MMLSKKACLLAVLLATVFALASADSKPSQCDAATGKWKPASINCDFSCASGGWELDCQCKSSTDCSMVKCKVDKDGAPKSEDIKFTCEVPTKNEAPKCDVGTIGDMCARDVVEAVLAQWKVSTN